MLDPAKRLEKFLWAVERWWSGIASIGVPPIRRRVSVEEEDPTPINAPATPERITTAKISILPTPNMLIILKPSF